MVQWRDGREQGWRKKKGVEMKGWKKGEIIVKDEGRREEGKKREMVMYRRNNGGKEGRKERKNGEERSD